MSEDFRRNNSTMVNKPTYYTGDNYDTRQDSYNNDFKTENYTYPEKRVPRDTRESHSNGEYHIPVNNSQEGIFRKFKYFVSSLSPLGILLYGAPVIAVILIPILIISLIISSGHKIKVNTCQVSVGEIHSTYTQEGYFYCDTKNDIYRVAFIDDDYAEHGIQESSNGTVINPDDNSCYNLVVTEIKEFENDSDDGFYKYLLDVFNSDDSETDDTEESTDEYDVSSEYSEETTETSEDNIGENTHHVVIMTVSLPATEEMTMKQDRFVTVELVTQNDPNALSVPSSAIIKEGDDNYVLVVSGKKVKKMNVSTGAIGSGNTEIISKDITEDSVIVKNALDVNIASITDGSKIKVIKETD